MVLRHKGMKTEELITIPELDVWDYNTTRYGEPAVGKAMVCCVFVCNSWKAAGIFGDIANEINCAEQVSFTGYSISY